MFNSTKNMPTTQPGWFYFAKPLHSYTLILNLGKEELGPMSTRVLVQVESSKAGITTPRAEKILQE